MTAMMMTVKETHQMNCTICRTGETSPGTVTVTLQRGESTLVIKNVPADVCANCGEYYLSGDVAARVTQLAENVLSNGAEVGIIRYAA